MINTNFKVDFIILVNLRIKILTYSKINLCVFGVQFTYYVFIFYKKLHISGVLRGERVKGYKPLPPKLSFFCRLTTNNLYINYYSFFRVITFY